MSDDDDVEAETVIKLDWPLLAALAAVIGVLVFWRRRKHRGIEG
jgi:hypothetical protein